MRKIHVLLALLVACISIHAQDLYIRYDAACMDKMEYQFIEQTGGVSYTAYRLNKNTAEKLFFETGIESPVISKTAPKKMLACNQITLSRQDAININNGSRRVFLVKKLDSGWTTVLVNAVSYMRFNGNNLTYVGPDFDLQGDIGQLGGVDLSESRADSKSMVFYETEFPACNSNAYLFKKSPRETCREESKVSIHPQIGLLQETLGGQTFELVSVNGRPACEYQGPKPVTSAEPKPEDIPQSYSVQPVVRPITTADIFDEEVVAETVVDNTPTEFSSKSAEQPMPISNNDCGVVAQDGEHVVQQGESLFGIARRYGLSVAQLRDWNSLSSDLIYNCSTLKIAGPPKVAENIPSMTESRVNDVPMSYEGEDKESRPYPKITYYTGCELEATEGEHVVQYGETLYSIARKYNVKVDQIRTWNKMTGDQVNVCTKLNIVAPAQPIKTVVTAKAVPTKKVVPKAYNTVVKPKATPSVAKATEKPKTIKKQPIVTEKSIKKSDSDKVAALTVKKGSGLYVVKKGETVGNLAKRYGMKEADFRKLNNLTKDEKVVAGQVVKIEDCACKVEEDLPKSYDVVVKPKAVAVKNEDIPTSYTTVVMPKATAVKEVSTTDKSAYRSRKYHVVQSDENLEAISKKYGIALATLRKLNNLEVNETVIPNQLLVLE
jgi:LysM repeat protein